MVKGVVLLAMSTANSQNTQEMSENLFSKPGRPYHFKRYSFLNGYFGARITLVLSFNLALAQES